MSVVLTKNNDDDDDDDDDDSGTLSVTDIDREFKFYEFFFG